MFDFKKEERDFYLPPATPQIITVPAMNYIAVQGEGDPNEKEGAAMGFGFLTFLLLP